MHQCCCSHLTQNAWVPRWMFHSASDQLITRLSLLIHSSATANNRSTELLLFAFAVGIVVKCHGCLWNPLPGVVNMPSCCQIARAVTADRAAGVIIWQKLLQCRSFIYLLAQTELPFGVFHPSLRKRDRFSKKPKGLRAKLSHFFPEVDPEVKWTWSTACQQHFAPTGWCCF